VASDRMTVRIGAETNKAGLVALTERPFTTMVREATRERAPCSG
jgi:hypothetical protein